MFRFVYEAINAINANSLNIWIPVWLRLSSALISADHKTARVSCLGPDTNKSLDVTQHPIKPSPVFTLSPRLCLLSGFSLLNLLSETGRSLTLWLPQHWSLYNGPRVAHLTARLHCLRSPHFVFIFNENWVLDTDTTPCLYFIVIFCLAPCFVSLMPAAATLGQDRRMSSPLTKSSGQLWQHRMSRPRRRSRLRYLYGVNNI